METTLFNDYQTMINKATEKGLSIWRENNSQGCEMIGIENKNSIVYWYEIAESGFLYFNHAYNRNSGKVYKGFKMGFNFKYKMIY